MSADEILKQSGEAVVQFTILCDGNASKLFGPELLVERSEDKLKRLYKRLAIKLHPDKNDHPDAGKAFQILQSLFESTLTSFTQPAAAPVPQQPKQQPAQPRHTAQHPSHASKQAQSTAYPPPPPPRRQPQRDEFEDIPLPPDVFADMEWDDWSDKMPGASNATHSSKPPPPPPPPHRSSATGAPPPPPPPPHSGWGSWPPPPPPAPPGGHQQPSVQKSTRAPTQLPGLDSSEEDEIETLKRKVAAEKKRKMSDKKASHGSQGFAMPSLDDSDGSSGDDSSVLQSELARKEAALAAKRKAQQQQQKMKEAEEQRKSRIASKSLHQLFADFGISDDDEEPLGDVKRNKGRVGPLPGDVPHSPASPSAMGNSKEPKGPVRTKQSVRPQLVAVCPMCSSQVTVIDMMVSTLCTSCNKFFVPSISSGGPAATSKVGRCSCGKAKKGHCFLCE